MTSTSSKPLAGVHQVSHSGFAKGTNASYDALRPSYPAATLNRIASQLASTPGAPSKYLILEPGSGTGIMSRLLLQPQSAEYPSIPIAQLIGIEPSEGMREQWAASLERLGPDVQARARAVSGTFEDFQAANVSEGTVDGIVIAQAWHWCPDHEAALAEAARYLKPGAPLFLVWNLESSRPEHFYSAVQPLLFEMDLGTPQYARGYWRKCLETKAYKELFEPMEEAHDQWIRHSDEEQYINRVLTNSYLTPENLSGQARETFLQRLRQAIRDKPKEWVDEQAGVFKIHYNTDLFIFRRKT